MYKPVIAILTIISGALLLVLGGYLQMDRPSTAGAAAHGLASALVGSVAQAEEGTQGSRVHVVLIAPVIVLGDPQSAPQGVQPLPDTDEPAPFEGFIPAYAPNPAVPQAPCLR